MKMMIYNLNNLYVIMNIISFVLLKIPIRVDIFFIINFILIVIIGDKLQKIV